MSLENLSGYYTSAIASGTNTGETDGFKSGKTLNINSIIGSYVLLTTGATETVKKMNIYDIEGNLWEWTTETAYRANTANTENTNNTYMLRGGGKHPGYTVLLPACFRAFDHAPSANFCDGFRPALFLQ